MSAATATATPVLRLQGITKSFFGVEVLKGVDLDCQAGQVHAIVGENGAGKSTLMKIVAGAQLPDGGTMELDGQPVHFTHPRQAQQHGIGIVYQEFNLLLERTVAQNMYLGREPRRGPLVDTKQMAEWTQALLERLGVADSISPRSLVRDLSVAQQQMVEIAKALSQDARVLIMDEPTASLSSPEAAALFERIRALRAKGFVILYISHRLQEVFDLADQITVIKDGAKVGTVSPADVTTEDLVRMMVGRDLQHYYPERGAAEDLGPTRLRVRGGGTGLLHGIDLELRAGEVVGVAGLEGSGRTELAQAIFGVHHFQRGVVEIDGTGVLIRSPRDAIARGLGFITEDRKAEGLILPRSVAENTALVLRSLSSKARRSRKDRRPLAEVIRDLTKRVELRAHSLDREVRFLSGGNQQKVVLAKWLATEAQILIFDEPTRGIDVGAKAGIHELIRELARAGAAVLMISSELPEVIGMSDRVLVMRAGRLVGELPANPTEPQIMSLAAGSSGPIEGDLAS